MQAITIRPCDQGWFVQYDQVDNPMAFKSGAKAENAAKLLAEKLADAGHQAQIVVYLRDGTVGGRFVATPTTQIQRASTSGPASPSE